MESYNSAGFRAEGEYTKWSVGSTPVHTQYSEAVASRPKPVEIWEGGGGGKWGLSRLKPRNQMWREIAWVLPRALSWEVGPLRSRAERAGFY